MSVSTVKKPTERSFALVSVPFTSSLSTPPNSSPTLPAPGLLLGSVTSPCSSKEGLEKRGNSSCVGAEVTYLSQSEAAEKTGVDLERGVRGKAGHIADGHGLIQRPHVDDSSIEAESPRAKRLT